MRELPQIFTLHKANNCRHSYANHCLVVFTNIIIMQWLKLAKKKCMQFLLSIEMDKNTAERICAWIYILFINYFLKMGG